jgi:hypothetical protein
MKIAKDIDANERCTGSAYEIVHERVFVDQKFLPVVPGIVVAQIHGSSCRRHRVDV